MRTGPLIRTPSELLDQLPLVRVRPILDTSSHMVCSLKSWSYERDVYYSHVR